MLVGTGVAGGVVTAVVGGSSLITFPALLAAGLPPIVATASNTVALTPGNFAAGLADLERRPPWDRSFLGLIVVAIAGRGGGAGPRVPALRRGRRPRAGPRDLRRGTSAPLRAGGGVRRLFRRGHERDDPGAALDHAGCGLPRGERAEEPPVRAHQPGRGDGLRLPGRGRVAADRGDDGGRAGGRRAGRAAGARAAAPPPARPRDHRGGRAHGGLRLALLGPLTRARGPD